MRKKKDVKIICHPNARRHVNGVCINCYSKELKKRNPEYRKNQLENSRKQYKRLGPTEYNKSNIQRNRNYRVEVIIKLGGKCKRCGYDDIRALHIDHVNGDGKKERGIRKSINRRFVNNLIDSNRYQLLCANCNWIKRLENNEGTNRSDLNQFLMSINEKLRNER